MAYVNAFHWILVQGVIAVGGVITVGGNRIFKGIILMFICNKFVLFTGPDWKRGDEDGGPSTVGTVIRKHRDGSVSVSTQYLYVTFVYVYL